MSGPAVPEPPAIRPPSEAGSLLLRVTRGCPWNRCRFCGIYAALGQPGFAVRPAGEVIADIALHAAGGSIRETLFLGDADPLAIPFEAGLAILSAARRLLPRIRRVTAYARAATLRRLGPQRLARLAGAGLDRVHVGLESGDRKTLAYHRKGQTPELAAAAGRMAKDAGLEVSFYVLLGLGGRKRWREHVDGTVEVLAAVDPQFVRVRRLWIYGPGDAPGRSGSPLLGEVAAGRFEPQDAEGTVLELRRLVASAAGLTGRIECDHANNFVRVSGRLPGDREAMLGDIDRFLGRTGPEREAHYGQVGSRI